MKIEPTDIVNRIAHAKPEFWFGSKPKIKLTGEDNTFGILSFEFDDDIIKYKILIKNRINKPLKILNYIVFKCLINL